MNRKEKNVLYAIFIEKCIKNNKGLIMKISLLSLFSLINNKKDYNLVIYKLGGIILWLIQIF